jgi:single-strand DNA-binding protein
MSNEFRGTGNLGDNPALKFVSVKGEDRAVMEMRIFFDAYKSDGDGNYEQVGGFWMNASLWGPRAESASKLLRKGARVRVEGRLKEQEWEDKETGEIKKRMQLDADEVFVSLSRVESITYKAKSEKQEHAAG